MRSESLEFVNPSMAPIGTAAVWPALLLEGRILTWWAILVGLVVEYFFVRNITELSWSRAALADVAMNAATSVIGILLIPISGIAWEIFPGILLTV